MCSVLGRIAVQLLDSARRKWRRERRRKRTRHQLIWSWSHPFCLILEKGCRVRQGNWVLKPLRVVNYWKENWKAEEKMLQKREKKIPNPNHMTMPISSFSLSWCFALSWHWLSFWVIVAPRKPFQRKIFTSSARASAETRMCPVHDEKYYFADKRILWNKATVLNSCRGSYLVGAVEMPFS